MTSIRHLTSVILLLSLVSSVLGASSHLSRKNSAQEKNWFRGSNSSNERKSLSDVFETSNLLRDFDDKVSNAPRQLETESNQNVFVFVQGAKLVGGTNGMVFDAENNLYVAQVLGQRISKLDPESGDILQQLGLEESVVFADDVAIGPNNTLYWTDTIVGTLHRRSLTSDGQTESLYPPNTYPNANPLAFSNDKSRLFFAQCFGELNGIYQLDLATGNTTTLVADVPGCASNSMDFKDEALYGPRLFEGRIYKLDLENDNAITDVSTGMRNPVAVKFDSQGRLHALDGGTVYRIDTESSDTANNRQLIAQAPFDSLDNLAFDKDDRLYISSYGQGTVLEVLENDFRTVSPGDVTLMGGVALMNDILYVVSPLGIYTFNAATAEPLSIFDPLPGTSDLSMPTLVVAWDEKDLLLQPSFTTNVVVAWNVTTNTAEMMAQFDNAPTDVLPYRDGVLVADLSGKVILATGTDLSNRQVLASVTEGPLFLAGNDETVYVSNTLEGTILQIVANGEVLGTPMEVSSGHDAPEGLVLLEDKQQLLVVATGTGTLERVDLETGGTTVVASGLEFLPPIPNIFPYGYSNDTVVYDGHAYVNGDGANVIYKINLEQGAEPTSGSVHLWTSSLVIPGMILVHAGQALL